MSTNLAKQSDLNNQYDRNSWGGTHNDGHTPLGQVENIIITVDSATEFSIKAGTQFYRYDTDTFTSPATPATGNGSYPNSTLLTYYSPDAIFETGDRAIEIGVTSGFSSANGTFYIYCSGSDDSGVSTKGNGVYDANTTAPVWDETKNGWYNSTEKCIGRYVVTSAVISEFAIFQGRCKKRGYIEHGGITTSGTVLTISKPVVDLNGKLIQFIQDVNSDFNGLSAGWWFNGFAEIGRPGRFTRNGTGGITEFGGAWNPVVASNQLDMFRLYDDEKKYCFYTAGTETIRNNLVIYWNGSTFDMIEETQNIPYSKVNAQLGTLQGPFSGIATVIYDQIDLDMNKEYDNTTGIFTQNIPNQIITGVGNINALTSFTGTRAIRADHTKKQKGFSGWKSAAATAEALIETSIIINSDIGDTLKFDANMQASTSLSVSGGTAISIIGSEV
jgi:hypothetical protein